MKKIMKQKKGFVFLETVVALVMVSLILAITLSSFSIITRKTYAQTYYNQPSDRYLLYSISRLGIDYTFNAPKKDDNNATYFDSSVKINKKSCSSIDTSSTDNDVSYLRKIFTNNTESTSTASKNCEGVFENSNLKNLYILKIDNNFSINGKDISSIVTEINTNPDAQDNKIENGTAEFLKTLSNNTSGTEIWYMVGVFERNDKYYYASIKIDGNSGV